MNNNTIAKNTFFQHSINLSAHQQNLLASEAQALKILKYRGKTYLASDLKYKAKFSTSLYTHKYRGVSYSSCIFNLASSPYSNQAKSSTLLYTGKYRGVNYSSCIFNLASPSSSDNDC
ncbi:MAG: hypothetical protein AAGF83_27310 [Cyanobacteria bacterium P01_G01_bin.67]